LLKIGEDRSNRFKKQEAAAAPAAVPEDDMLLRGIRDVLKKEQ
jgi:hypothetical protein